MKTTQTRRMTLGLALALSMGLALRGVRPGRVAGRPERVGEPDGLADAPARSRTRRPTWGRHPQGRQLVQNAQGTRPVRRPVPPDPARNPDAYRLRQAFSGIDYSWQYLRGQLSQPGVTTPVVDRDARAVDEADARLRQALGLNNPPQGFYGGAAAARRPPAEPRPSGWPPPWWTGRTGCWRRSSRRCPARSARRWRTRRGGWHCRGRPVPRRDRPEPAAQGVRPGLPPRRRLRRSPGAVHRQQRTTSRRRVQNAWQAFASVEVLIHQNLGLASPQPGRRGQRLAPPPGGGPSPIVGPGRPVRPADRRRSSRSSARPAGRSPRGVHAGRRPAAPGRRRQLPPGRRGQARPEPARLRVPRRRRRLAAPRPPGEPRSPAARWARTSHQVQKLGAICEQIHQVLGMPGYPPAFNGPSFDQPPPPPQP